MSQKHLGENEPAAKSVVVLTALNAAIWVVVELCVAYLERNDTCKMTEMYGADWFTIAGTE